MGNIIIHPLERCNRNNTRNGIIHSWNTEAGTIRGTVSVTPGTLKQEQQEEQQEEQYHPLLEH